jgi:predicted transcriptional regulator
MAMNPDFEEIKKIPTPQLLDVAKALASDLRLRIIEALSEGPMSVSQLAKQLGVAQPTISINVSMLEEIGLIATAQRLGRGKICMITCHSLLLDLPRIPGNVEKEWKEIEMPVGMYTDFQVKPTCGLVGKDGLIGYVDDLRTFYLPDRSDANLLWFGESGYVEYTFPNIREEEAAFTAISISAELCSEYLGYKENWPSDITLLVNGMEIGTFTSPGDFGKEKGLLTPSWWYGGTQYGQLTEWTIHAEGSLLNNEPCSPITLSDLQVALNESIRVRFEVKGDAANRGGLNLFGADFGNEPQAIILKFLR